MKNYKLYNQIAIVGYLVVILLESSLNFSKLVFALMLVPFTMLSIIAAFVYKTVPIQDKEKPTFFAASILGIHPYVTTAVFTLVNLLILILSLVK